MANEVVDALLDLEKGDTVCLEAEYYEWGSPFEVDAIEGQTWAAPNGGVWTAKHIELEATSANGADREFDVYPHASPPFLGKGYGVLTAVEPADEDQEKEDGDEADRPDWLERPADEIVEVSPVRHRTLPEILSAVERQDTILDVHKRIASGNMNQTRELLWQLGLRGQDGRLLDDDVLEERISEIREVYVDE